MDETFLDFEFERYIKIVQPYLDELADKEAAAVGHAWLDKLSTCANRDQRNKCIFQLLSQLTIGALQEPFTKHPPSGELEELGFKSDGADVYFSNLKCFANDRDTSPLAAGDKTSLAPDKSCQTFILKESSSHSNVKVKHDPLINIKTNNSTIENRVKNLIMNIRHMKRENAILHQLLNSQEECKNHWGYFLENFKESTRNLYPQLKYIPKFQIDVHEPSTNTQSEETHKINETKIKVESIVSKPYLDLFEFKNSNEQEIIKNYENKIMELTKQHINIFDGMRLYYNKLFHQQENAYREKIIERDSIIKAKDAEIAHLHKSIVELQTQIPLKNFSMPKIEQRLYKIERTTSKCLKKYQRKILKQRQKYIRDCILFLDLIQQKSNVADDVKEDLKNTSPMKKLEEKYKNIVAKVQTTALQRMIQDQLTMEALVKKVSKISFTCLKSTQMNNVHNKTGTQFAMKDPNTPHEPNNEVNDQTSLPINIDS